VKVVLDTNIIVSRFLSPHGFPALILAFWEKGLFELVASEAILAEYGRVLGYPSVQARHQLRHDEIAQVVEDFRTFATVVRVQEPVDVIVDDPSDNRFLEAAVHGVCDYIVSGDPHLLRVGEFRGITILTPAAFVAVLEVMPLSC
jgi:putative PIN family toxin of toxin-antitoxin system